VKNENRSIFGQYMDKTLWLTFLGHPVCVTLVVRSHLSTIVSSSLQITNRSFRYHFCCGISAPLRSINFIPFTLASSWFTSYYKLALHASPHHSHHLRSPAITPSVFYSWLKTLLFNESSPQSHSVFGLPSRILDLKVEMEWKNRTTVSGHWHSGTCLVLF